MSRWESEYALMIANANGESDRGCALILAANLDNRLRALLENFFVVQPSRKLEGIFQGNGCLSTFSSRISVSFSVGLISKDEQHDLDVIRAIRNDFAHNEDAINFSISPVHERCGSLLLYQNMKADRPDINFSIHTSRNKFEIVCVSLCLILEDRVNDAVKNRRSTPESRSILPKGPALNG